MAKNNHILTTHPTFNPVHQHHVKSRTRRHPTPHLLGSGGSARYEMLLERLPYLPIILRKHSMPSPSIAATITEIRRITSFSAGGGTISISPEDDQDVEDEVVGENEQWSTDKPGPETPKRKRRNRIEGTGAVQAAVPGMEEKNGVALVLSDDDIED
jgi:cell cycle checkpoint protein